MIWLQILIELIGYLVIIYSVLFITFNICLGVISLKETRYYLRKNTKADYKLLASSPYAPSLSIVAPCFNEANNIVQSVRSLLSNYYFNLEIIVVNDGSTDNSMQLLYDAYDLQKAHHFVQGKLNTESIHGIYKSINPAFSKLVVVDKANGGKADALNAGINVSGNQYIISIDADCILAEDALLKIIKPIIDETEGTVIASGGVVRIANSCLVEDGKLVKVNLPVNLLARIQVLEYMRAFLLGRMAWSRLNGLLLISGAFGAFNKEILINSGGYNSETIGEDMELVVRMRRYMQERKLPYKVTYIPDPLCWTEAPSTLPVLIRQRNRWMRGALQTLQLHQVLCFNRTYGLMGLISYPYWLFFEVGGPIIESVGTLVFLLGIIFGLIKWKIFFAILFLLLSIGIINSLFGIFMEVMSYHQYKKPSDILKLILVAFIEPFLFHPIIVYANVCGIIDYLRKNNEWGVMTRSGFKNNISLNTPNLLYGLDERKQ
ncbi:MAG: glycosyltransferase family 2 protein [Chitinophagaceae bacterium]|nr:glycosyltransferase family 2 protein [Chitinophagaceae bacterium]